MRERLNRADSKSVELLASSVGSNPTLSVLAMQLFEIVFGEMTERPKVHAWKACVLYPGTEGSNPSLSDTPSAFLKQALRCRLLPNPVRTGR